LKNENRQVTIITQNIDELHRRAGSENVIELHGTLFKTRCMKCGDIAVNKDSPITPALKDKGSPDPNVMNSNIPLKDLPHCKKLNCAGLLRPHVVWFGEPLEPEIIEEAQKELDDCDLCLVIGTSSVVYPAAMFAPQVASRGVPVAEFNIEKTQSTNDFGFHFEGPSG
ncbi:NAD-dependent protein deacylase-like protein, partial [Leptotrombidium deliense]